MRGGLVVGDGLVPQDRVHGRRGFLVGARVHPVGLRLLLGQQDGEDAVLQVAERLVVADEGPHPVGLLREDGGAEEVVPALDPEHPEEGGRHVQLADRSFRSS